MEKKHTKCVSIVRHFIILFSNLCINLYCSGVTIVSIFKLYSKKGIKLTYLECINSLFVGFGQASHIFQHEQAKQYLLFSIQLGSSSARQFLSICETVPLTMNALEDFRLRQI